MNLTEAVTIFEKCQPTDDPPIPKSCDGCPLAADALPSEDMWWDICDLLEAVRNALRRSNE